MKTMIISGLGLAALFGLMTGSATPGDAGIALVMGAVVAMATCRGGGPTGAVRLRGAPRFAAGVAIELLQGVARTARALLHRDPDRRAGFVEISIDDESEAGFAIWAMVISAAPGTVVAHVDRGRGVMAINAIDATDPEAVREDTSRFLLRFQRPLTPARGADNA